MARSIFTVEQLKWLRSFAKEYDDRVKYCIFPETGTQFAQTRAEEFANQWENLADGTPYTRKEIIKKVVNWFRNSNQARRSGKRTPQQINETTLTLIYQHANQSVMTSEPNELEVAKWLMALKTGEPGVILTRK